jgi:hypothetical protein
MVRNAAGFPTIPGIWPIAGALTVSTITPNRRARVFLSGIRTSSVLILVSHSMIKEPYSRARRRNSQDGRIAVDASEGLSSNRSAHGLADARGYIVRNARCSIGLLAIL